jgi:hypothetical protein
MLTIKSLLQRQKAYEIYDSCDTLPLYNFIEVLTSGKPDKLAKSGTPPQSALNQAWATISEEYAELSDSNTAKHLLKIQIDIEYMRNQLRITQTILNELNRTGYSEELAGLLGELNYTVFYNGDVASLIENILNQSKSIQTDLEDKLDEYKEMQKKGDKETTKTGYYELLYDMGLRPDVSVTYFIGAYNLYTKKNGTGQTE